MTKNSHIQVYIKYNSVYTWLKKRCLGSINHERQSLEDLWVYIHKQSKLILSSQVYIVMSCSCECKPLKHVVVFFMQSSKKAFNIAILYRSLKPVQVNVSLSRRKPETIFCTFLECIIAKSFDNKTFLERTFKYAMLIKFYL